MAVLFRLRHIVSVLLIAGLLIFVAQNRAFSASSVTVAWQPSDDTSVVGYNVYVGGASQTYTNSFSVVGATNAIVSGLLQGATYYFAITAYDDTGLESPFSNEASYAVPVSPVNQQPTLNAIGNLTINQNTGPQTVSLSGISSGAANEIQTLTVTAVSSNPALIPNPAVSYASPNATGSLTFTPASNASGTATVTVTVNDGGTSNNIVTRTFTVTVNAVNQQPTLNAIGNLTINQSAGLQTVNLSGISSGAVNETQTLTVTAISSNPALIPNPAVAYASPNATGTLTFTPASNASGTATVTVTVNDGGASNNIVTQVFAVTVNAVNQQPTLNALGNLTINENASLQTVNLSGISSGAANETQTLTATAISSNPALIPNPTISYTSPNATGSLIFTPASNTSGTATVTVTVNDGGASNNVVTQTFTVTVNAVNQQPTLNAPSNLSINQNAGLQTVSLSGISSGAANEVQTLTVTAISSNPALIPNPVVGYTSPNATGSLTFTPASNLYGIATVTLTVNDGGTSNNVVTRTFTVTVNPVNQQPTLNTLGNLTINQNSGLQTVSLSGISSGAANETQTLTVTAISSNPALIPNPTISYTSPNSTGNLAFTPASSATGTATISVTVNDGGASNNVVIRTFTVTVNAVNQPPTLYAIANLTLSQNAGLQGVNLSGISSGAANEVQTLTVTAVSSDPTLISNPTISYTSPNSVGYLTFTPVSNASGTATISVTVNDGGSTNNLVTQTFAVTVNSATVSNTPPTLNAIGNLAINQNAGLQTVNLSGISSGAANETQTLTVTAVSSNPALIPNPVVNYASPNATGTLTFAPASGATGTATISVTVNDGGASSNIVTKAFTVTVNAVNQQPTLNTLANLSLNQNAGLQTVSMSGISSGAANEVQTLTVTAVSSNPTLIPNPTVSYTSPNATGTLSFASANNVTGTTTVTVTVNDGGASNNIVTRTFTITVNAVNQQPTLNALGNLTINQNVGLQTVNLSGISSGAANEVQTLTITAVSSNPALIPNPTINYTSPNATGTLTFTPASGVTGTATISVTVNDGGTSNNIATQTFTVTVNGVNQQPTLNAIGNLTINENAGLQTVNLSGISSGAANESQTLAVTAVSSNPALIPNPAAGYTSPNTTGSLTFTPASNASGTATVTVTVNDGGTSNNVVTRTFTVTVNAVNQQPTLNAIGNLTLNQNAGLQTVSLSGISSGAASEPQTLTITAVSSNPALIPNPAVGYSSPNATGSLTFTPANNASGTATVTVTVNDGGRSNNILTRTFSVTVNAPPNTPPTLNALANLTLNENAGLQGLNLSGISAGAANEIQNLTVTAISSNPSLIPNPTVSYASPNSVGYMTYAPANNASGTAIISVTVNDGGASNNIVTQTFTVTVNSPDQALTVNQPPTLNALGNLTINQDAGLQSVGLGGISSGAANETQTLTVTAVSSNPALISNPAVNYASPNATGTLSFATASGGTGTANITVSVNDGGASNNIVTQTFTVTVNAVDQPPTVNPVSDFYLTKNAPAQTVTLSGISPGATGTSSGTSSASPNTASVSPSTAGISSSSGARTSSSKTSTSKTAAKKAIKITAVSGNTKLLTNPTIRYTSGSSTGTLTFKPVKNATGTTTITVTINNGEKVNNITKITFHVTILASVAALPVKLTAAPHAEGQFALTIAGVSGTKYIIQASTNMIDWVPVYTNSAPFTFTDNKAGQFSQRFYRSVSVP